MNAQVSTCACRKANQIHDASEKASEGSEREGHAQHGDIGTAWICGRKRGKEEGKGHARTSFALDKIERKDRATFKPTVGARQAGRGEETRHRRNEWTRMGRAPNSLFSKRAGDKSRPEWRWRTGPRWRDRDRSGISSSREGITWDHVSLNLAIEPTPRVDLGQIRQWKTDRGLKYTHEPN
jgi:hypothetical protein